MKTIIPIILTLFLATISIGQAPILLKDINLEKGSYPANFLKVGNTIYFTAKDKINGTELWKADATSGVVSLVKDIYQGETSSSPYSFSNINDTLIFVATGSNNAGAELWRSDGTAAGTTFIKDISPSFPSSNPTLLTRMGNFVYFSAGNATTGTELWRTDGTDAGTTVVKDINPGSGSTYIYEMVVANNTIFFTADADANGMKLWKSDGTDAGTVLIKDSITIRELTAFNNMVFFRGYEAATSFELWKSDGTDAGTVMVKELNPSGLGISNQYGRAGALTVYNNALYFAGIDNNGTELWKTDGTDAGTVMVKDINSTPNGSIPAELVVCNNLLLFVCDDGVNGRELWKSDGTNAGTVLVKDINLGVNSALQPYSFSFSTDNKLTVSGSTLFFIADNATNGKELWKSDGTTAGTVMVKDIDGVSTSTTLSGLTPFGANQILFSADEGTNGSELWVSDGTTAGTVLKEDIFTGSASTNFHEIAILKNKVWFTASEPNLYDASTSTQKLWVTDGTIANTTELEEIPSNYSAPSNMVELNNFVYYCTAQSEIHKSDGTAAGTSMVWDASPGGGGSGTDYQDLTVLGNNIYFRGKTANNIGGSELFKFNPATSTVSMVRDINTTSTYASSDIYYFTKMGNQLFFRANDGVNGFELWKTSGDSASTVMVKDINPTGFGYTGGHEIAIGNTLYFSANDGVNGSELWKSDGTDAGTVMVKDIATSGSSSPMLFLNLNNTAVFVAHDAANGAELWKSDGTAAGTVMVKDIYPGTSSGVITYKPTIFNNKVYFTGSTQTTGYELWSSDGTDAGTMMVKDLNPGNIGSAPHQLTPGSAKLYFVANDNLGVYGLYETDGTDTSTQLLFAFDASLGFSYIDNLTFHGKLYFTANHPDYGTELWSYDTGTGTIAIDKIEDTKPFATLFPNPNNGQFTIELKEIEDVNLRLVSATGAVVKEDRISGNSLYTVDMQDLPQGIYFAYLHKGTKTQVLKFVKQ